MNPDNPTPETVEIVTIFDFPDPSGLMLRVPAESRTVSSVPPFGMYGGTVELCPVVAVDEEGQT